MANPFAKAPWFHKVGHVTNTRTWRMLPTPRGLGVLTTTGRKSGKARHRALRVVGDGDRMYAVAMLGPRCDWVRNIRANPAVRLKLGGRTYDGTASVLSDPADVARASETYLTSAGWFDYADYANLMWSIPTRAKVRRSHEQLLAEGIPVAIDITRR